MSGLAAGRAAGADLVIGVGNPLRGDDGAGWWLARRARRHRPPPAVRLVRQVTPELALELAEARRVLFVDAWCAGGPDPAPLLRTLRPEQAGEVGVGGGHGLDPAGLLALVGLLGGVTPPGWLLLVPAFAFPHGTALSEGLRARLPEACRLLESWLTKKPP